MNSNKELKKVLTKKILTHNIILFHNHLELLRIFKDSRFSNSFKDKKFRFRDLAAFAELKILSTI